MPWDSTLLCKGCGKPLALSWKNPETDRFEQILESGQDSGGDFFRCTHCGGRHYYTVDAQGAPALRNFEPGPPFYRLKRKLGFTK